jgi:hypothetical protein
MSGQPETTALRPDHPVLMPEFSAAKYICAIPDACGSIFPMRRKLISKEMSGQINGMPWHAFEPDEMQKYCDIGADEWKPPEIPALSSWTV